MFEKYSKENFEEAKEQEKSQQEKLELEKNIWDKSTMNPFIGYRKLRAAISERKSEKLLGMAQEEAEELNQQYEELKLKAEEALTALENFEREKLGMKEKEEN